VRPARINRAPWPEKEDFEKVLMETTGETLGYLGF